MNRNKLNGKVIGGAQSLPFARFVATQAMRLVGTASMTLTKYLSANQTMRLEARTAYRFFKATQAMIANGFAKMTIYRQLALSATLFMRMATSGRLITRVNMGASQAMALIGSGILSAQHTVSLSGSAILRLVGSLAGSGDAPAERTMSIEAGDRVMYVEATSGVSQA